MSIWARASRTGTTTGADGEFSIEVSAEDTLVFSFVGYSEQEVPTFGRSELLIIMVSDAKSLDEVVIVGYGEQKKENLTGAVSQVKMADVLGNRPVSNAATALQGAIPGLQILSNSGRPGESSSLAVRGIMSISGGSPLVLVDNVPMNIDDLNPADIETVTVLKDASASSIYGGRAAFGVILITTKKGKRNEAVRFNYSTNLTFSQASNLPRKASTLATVQAWKDFGNTVSWFGQDLDIWTNLLLEYQEDPGKYPEGETRVNGVLYRLEEKDFYRDFMPGGFEHMHNFAVSGGSEKTSYRVSLGYANEDGIMASNKDSYKKYNLNAFLSTALSDRLTADLNILYRNDRRLTPASYGKLFMNGIRLPKYVEYEGVWTNPDGSTLPYDSPKSILEIEPPDQNTGDNVRIFGKLNYRAAKGLNIIAEYTFDKQNDEQVAIKTNNMYLHAYTYDRQRINEVSSYSRSYLGVDYSALNVYAQYETGLGSHHLRILLGTNQELSKSSMFSTQRDNLLSISTPSLATASGNMVNDESFDDFTISGYFARINYDYQDRYLLELNSRYDGSSRFPRNHRFGLFPSLSAGWVISRESFMENLAPTISLLKVRGSWGEIGNQSIANYAYIPAMPTGNADWFNASTNLRYLTIFAPPLVSNSFTWETVSTRNLGIDIGLFSNQLMVTFDYFRRVTLNMLGEGAELPAVLGAPAPKKNVADLVSKGWETSVTWRKSSGALQYSLALNLSDSRGFVTQFNNAEGLLNQYYQGYAFGEIWGYVTDGFYTVDDFVHGTLDANLLNGTLKEGVPSFHTIVRQNPGDIRFRDLNGDGIISPGNNTLANPGDRRIIGNNTRRFQYGILGQLQYAQFDLSAFIQGIGKRDIWFGDQLYWPYTDNFTAFYEHHLDYWTPDNPNAFFPRSYVAAGGNTPTSRSVQTKYLANGAYLRIKNISLGYTLPSHWSSRIYAQGARIFLSGENLWTFDHLPDGMDPEILNVNWGGGYPFLRKFSLGVNLTF